MEALAEQPEEFDFLGFRVRCLHTHNDSASAVLEWHAPPRSGGPPLHLHRRTEEGFYVIRGSLALQVDDQLLMRRAGAYVLVRPGQRHTFWNPGGEPAAYLTLISPPGFEQYLLQLALGLQSVHSDDEAAALRARLGEHFDVTVLGPPRAPA